ncbi:hypothetical protein M3Y96_00339600 [Aphelenchoides besseyi]|nr:hypothetical protein M3Y96_00339600 [Aphelenchoides besseyi]
MNEFSLGSNLAHHTFINDSIHGPSRDAAEFMTELQEENPETYETWLRLRSRDEFNEKFRRSFISALCKFCINRKQMELARYRRDFVAAVLLYTKADIGVNVFCDKNGGGYLNNSLKSRRAYQKRRRESNWQSDLIQQNAAVHESAFSTLLRSFQQHSTPTPRNTSVAELLARSDSLEPIHVRSPSPLISPSTHVSTTLLTCEAAEESQSKERSASSSCASESLSSASTVSVFVRFRTVNDSWHNVDVKQTKLTLHSFATVQTLFLTLLNKWQLDGEETRLVLRAFDRDFGEFVDIEENFESVCVENLSKFELVHRRISVDQNERAVGSEPSENRTPCSTRSGSPPTNGLAGLLNELTTPKPNNDNWTEALRSAAAFLERSQPVEADEADVTSGKFGLSSTLFQSSSFAVDKTSDPLDKMNASSEEFTPIDLLSVLSKTDYGRILLEQLNGPTGCLSAKPENSLNVQSLGRKRPRPVSP